MTRLEFMKELESLLLDIPLEERNEALQYYNGYFDDAGEEQEEEIVKELGSPEKVAAIIKSDLGENAAEREDKGFFTEKGYQETIGSEFEITKTGNNPSGQGRTGQGGTGQTYYNSNNKYNDNNRNYSGNGNYNSSGNHGGSSYQEGNNYTGYQNSSTAGGSSYTGDGKGKNSSGNVLLILLAVITSPIWLPILLTVLGVAIGVIVAVVGVLFGFGVAGISLIGAGLVLFVAGLAELATPFYGLLMLGGGLVCVGIGMMMTIAVGFVCKRVLPVLINGFVNLCKLPFKNRRAMA
ncbi:MAG TPA: DUF1700 domain-containing protein [Clostridiales bacterium]|nr:DUF1700 domain-containing protein [Clostridiales bacterium]